MAAAAVDDGVDTIAATPHLRSDYPAVRPEDLDGHCAGLRAALKDMRIPLTIVSGAEVDLAWSLTASAEQLRQASYGGAGVAILVETPYGPLPPRFEEHVFDRFAAHGMRVLLAHPERNFTFQSDPRRLASMVERGVTVQVTAQALTRRSRRSRSTRLARSLVGDGLAHVLASDAHGPPGGRAVLSDGVAAAARLDRRRAGWMVTDAPAAILSGDPLTPPTRAGWRPFRRRAP